MRQLRVLVDSSWEKHQGLVYKGNKQVRLLEYDFTIQDIENLNGSFGFIYESNTKITLVVDGIRSIPIFYYITNDTIYVSDSAVKIADELKISLNADSVLEFHSCGYVIGNKSLYEGVNQVLPCELISVDKENGHVDKRKWHTYATPKLYSSSQPINNYIDELDIKMKGVFLDMIDRVGNRQIVVPLSGGLDSRTIVYYLKELGFEDVVCLSYGRRTSFEVEIAKQVARYLSVKWIFCEYDASLWTGFYNSREYADYMAYAGHGSEMPCYQALPAVKWALENNYIDKNAVVVPGHALDFICGSHYPEMLEKDIWSHRRYQRFIKERHYNLNKNTSSEISLNRIETHILRYGGVLDVLRDIFDFELNNRQGKFIANDVRAYEFFGLTYELPFWDTRLVDYFCSLPYELLHDRKLHRELLRNKVDNVTGVITNEAKSVNKSVKLILKEFVKTLFPFLRDKKREKYLIDSQYRNPNAFYDHIPVNEYRNLINKYGLGFNIDTLVAEAYLQQLES